MPREVKMSSSWEILVWREFRKACSEARRRAREKETMITIMINGGINMAGTSIGARKKTGMKMVAKKTIIKNTAAKNKIRT